MSKYQYTYSICISYPTYESANIVCQTINVDSELKPQQIQRNICVTTNNNDVLLHIEYKSNNLHLFRTAISSIYELIILSTQTIMKFQLTNVHTEQKQLNDKTK